MRLGKVRKKRRFGPGVANVTFDDVIDELKSMYAPKLLERGISMERLTAIHIKKWCEELSQSRSSLYDSIAYYLAYGFNNIDLSFSFCDAVVDDIHSIITCGDELRPKLFWQVFLAFDEGEHYHDNNRDEDPREAYTRPMIAEIISKMK
jgi:hypothetical protein